MTERPLKHLTGFAQANGSVAVVDELLLPYDTRKKSRFKARARSGVSWAVLLPRGQTLRHGTLLKSEAGELVRVLAAGETLSHVTGKDPWALARGAYHLGNRHMPLQLGKGWLRYQHDHVLDDMVRGLGLEVEIIEAGFEPEDGAYSGSGHGHDHQR